MKYVRLTQVSIPVGGFQRDNYIARICFVDIVICSWNKDGYDDPSELMGCKFLDLLYIQFRWKCYRPRTQ